MVQADQVAQQRALAAAAAADDEEDLGRPDGKCDVFQDDAVAVTALDALDIQGPPTSTALHRALVRDPDVAAHRTHTRWLESWLNSHPIAPSNEAER